MKNWKQPSGSVGSPRAKMLEVEELRREAEKLSRIFVEVQEDNQMLEEDLEKYKETVRVLNRQNEDLVNELERVSNYEEGNRSILNRKDRLEALISKAENHLSLNSRGLK